MNVITLVMALGVAYCTEALKCKQCLYLSGESNHELMTLILKSLEEKSDSHCLGEGSDATDFVCGSDSELREGKQDWKCGKADIKTTLITTQGGDDLSADLRIVQRGCLAYNESDANNSNGCHPTEAFEDDIRGSFTNDVTRLGDISGRFCLCDDELCNIGAATGDVASNDSGTPSRHYVPSYVGLVALMALLVS